MASGKTNTIAEKTCEVAQNGAQPVICDPHAHKPDSLYERVLPLAGVLFPGSVFAITHDDILSNVLLVRDELERRINGGSYHRPLVLVVDEWNRLQRDELIARELMLIATILGQEGRGFGVYGIFGAQRITYNAELRKSVIARIVHRCDESEARLVLPARYAKLAPELPNGLSLVADADGMVELLQQALITRQDITTLANSLLDVPHTPTRSGTSPRPTVKFTRDLRQTSQPFPNAPKQDERALERRLVRLGTGDETPFQTPKETSPNRVNVSPRVRAEIIKLAQAGVSRRKIKDQLGLHGARYEIVRRVLDEEGL